MMMMIMMLILIIREAKKEERNLSNQQYIPRNEQHQHRFMIYHSSGWTCSTRRVQGCPAVVEKPSVSIQYIIVVLLSSGR